MTDNTLNARLLFPGSGPFAERIAALNNSDQDNRNRDDQEYVDEPAHGV